MSAERSEERLRSWEPETLTVYRTAPRPKPAPVLPAHRRRKAARASKATYTRRRIVAALVLTLLVVSAWAAVRAVGDGATLGAPGQSPPMLPVGASTYEVQPGETFWSIANRLDPKGDPRPVVDRLVAAHGGAQLRAGEIIALPAMTDR